MERKNNKITDDGYWWVCFIPTNRLSVRLNSLTSLSSLCYVTCFCVYVVGIGFNWLKQKNLEKVTFLAIPRLMNLPGRIRSSFESAGVNWHCESAGEVAPKHWIRRGKGSWLILRSWVDKNSGYWFGKKLQRTFKKQLERQRRIYNTRDTQIGISYK